MAEREEKLKEKTIDYLRCPDGMAHVWSYRGKASQIYACGRCAITVTKLKLQEVSNAQLHS